MPTIAELKARLKSMNIKGVAKKNKAELMAMLEGSPVPARDRTPVAMSPRGASHLATAMNRLLGRGTGGAPPMSDALAKLREVEAATKARNEARAAAPVAAAPVAAAGGAGAPRPSKAAEIPEEIVEQLILPFVKGQEDFNLGRLMLLPAKAGDDKALLRSKGVLLLLDMLTQTIKPTMFYVPNHNMKYFSETYTDRKTGKLYLPDIDEYASFTKKGPTSEFKLLFEALGKLKYAGGKTAYWEPSVPQLAELKRGFPPYTMIKIKEGRNWDGRIGFTFQVGVESDDLDVKISAHDVTSAEKDRLYDIKHARYTEVARIAKSYLDRLAAKDYKAFFNFMDKTWLEARKAKKAAAK